MRDHLSPFLASSFFLLSAADGGLCGVAVAAKTSFLCCCCRCTISCIHDGEVCLHSLWWLSAAFGDALPGSIPGFGERAQGIQVVVAVSSPEAAASGVSGHYRRCTVDQDRSSS
jgi:hypothetical protein